MRTMAQVRLYTLSTDGAWTKAKFKHAKAAHPYYDAAISSSEVLAVSMCSHTPDDGTNEPPKGAGVYGTLVGSTVETLLARGIVRRNELGLAVLAKHVPETDGMLEESLFGFLDESTEVMQGRKGRAQ